MAGILGIGIAAGLVSALLTAVVTTGQPLAVVLFLLAPLPVAIAALGWRHEAGLVAALAGAVALGLGLSPRAALVHTVATSLPAWWLSYLVLLARHGPSSSGTPANDVTTWYPLGRLLLWIAGLGSALTLAGVLTLGLDYDAYERGFERALPLLEQFNPEAFRGLGDDERRALGERLTGSFAAWAPPASAAITVLTTTLILYAAGRAVLASGRLPRPWPAVAEASLPRIALPVLAVASVLALLEGYPGLAARTVAGGLLTAFGLQGLATMHVLTRGLPARTGLLAGLYALILLLGGWPPMLLLALIGVADLAVGLRRRTNKGPVRPGLD